MLSVPYAIKVDDVYCNHCNEDELYMDLNEEPSQYKIGAMCHSCDRDYGVLDRVSRTEVDHMDEVWEYAEEQVRNTSSKQ